MILFDGYGQISNLSELIIKLKARDVYAFWYINYVRKAISDEDWSELLSVENPFVKMMLENIKHHAQNNEASLLTPEDHEMISKLEIDASASVIIGLMLEKKVIKTDKEAHVAARSYFMSAAKHLHAYSINMLGFYVLNYRCSVSRKVFLDWGCADLFISGLTRLRQAIHLYLAAAAEGSAEGLGNLALAILYGSYTPSAEDYIKLNIAKPNTSILCKLAGNTKHHHAHAFFVRAISLGARFLLHEIAKLIENKNITTSDEDYKLLGAGRKKDSSIAPLDEALIFYRAAAQCGNPFSKKRIAQYLLENPSTVITSEDVTALQCKKKWEDTYKDNHTRLEQVSFLYGSVLQASDLLELIRYVRQNKVSLSREMLDKLNIIGGSSLDEKKVIINRLYLKSFLNNMDDFKSVNWCALEIENLLDLFILAKIGKNKIWISSIKGSIVRLARKYPEAKLVSILLFAKPKDVSQELISFLGGKWTYTNEKNNLEVFKYISTSLKSKSGLLEMPGEPSPRKEMLFKLLAKIIPLLSKEEIHIQDESTVFWKEEVGDFMGAPVSALELHSLL
jgi:TPR repeat protein